MTWRRAYSHGLSESVLRTEAIDYVVTKPEAALQKQFQNLDVELRGLKQRRQQVEAEIGRLVQAIADGRPPKSLMAAIAERVWITSESTTIPDLPSVAAQPRLGIHFARDSRSGLPVVN